MEKAVISNIQGYSIHDGPGIRTTVFFKGCPLRCKWCANPENLTASVTVGFLKNLCTSCGRCASACSEAAIVPGPPEVYRIDRGRCSGCGSCVDACYYGALVRYGEMMTVEEVFGKVRRDKMFYDSSGGGVTVSGGEPLIHSHFIRELFELCESENIHTCVETCGCVPEADLKEVFPVTDLFCFDLKHPDTEKHRQWTGRGNELILSNARLAVSQGKKVLFRMPLIPGVNDDDEALERTAEFLLSLGPEGREIQLMPYHRAGQTKYAALNMTCETDGIMIQPAEKVEAARKKLEDAGVICSISK